MIARQGISLLSDVAIFASVPSAGGGVAVKASQSLSTLRISSQSSNLYPIAQSVGASANKLYNSLAKVANKASGQTGRKASQLLQNLATKAGFEVRSGGKHLRVINPETNRQVTVIPHSPKARVVKSVIRDIFEEAGFE